MVATIESAQPLVPPGELLLLVGREIVSRDIAAQDVHPMWIRTQLVARTRDDRWSSLTDDVCRELATRAGELAEDEARDARLVAHMDPPVRAEAEERSKRAPLPRIWLDQAELPPHEMWLLKGLLGVRDLALVYGPPSCGKTFFTIDLVGSIVAGLGWRDRKTNPTLGIYIAAEAGRSILRRFIAWRDRKLGESREDKSPLAIVPRAINLMHASEVDDLVHQLREIAKEAALPLGVVVFDTLSRSMAGGDENSAQDMTRVIAAADRMREELGVAVILIHHSGKDAGKGARGHSALAAAADTVIAVDDRVATFEKVRDGVANMAFAFDLEVQEIGRDEDGEPITTCVAVPMEGAPAADGPRAVGLGANQEKALTILRKLRERARQAVDDRGDDASSTEILITGWRAECEKRGIDRRRWPEVRKALEDRGLVRFDGAHAIPVDVAP